MNDDKKIKYKKLENSVSSDPNRMYVSNNSDSENEENDYKKTDFQHLTRSDGFMRDLYNMFIGKKRRTVDESIECSDIIVDTELEGGYVSVVLKSMASESGVIENYLNDSLVVSLPPVEHAPAVIPEPQNITPDINKSYFECFEDTKSINNVINYKDETVNFGYDSGYYNEIKAQPLEVTHDLLPKSEYDEGVKLIDKSHENDKYIGKYGIYALSTIIVMSSAYIVGTL